MALNNQLFGKARHQSRKHVLVDDLEGASRHVPRLTLPVAHRGGIRVTCEKREKVTSEIFAQLHVHDVALAARIHKPAGKAATYGRGVIVHSQPACIRQIAPLRHRLAT